MQLSMVVTVADHHRSEKRLGRLYDKNQEACGWFKLLNKNGGDLVKPDHLLYEMEKRWCIRCNAIHWMFGEKIEFKQTVFNPNEYWYSELVEMGFFDQNPDADRPND